VAFAATRCCRHDPRPGIGLPACPDAQVLAARHRLRQRDLPLKRPGCGA
jgi:hypothetical protein